MTDNEILNECYDNHNSLVVEDSEVSKINNNANLVFNTTTDYTVISINMLILVDNGINNMTFKFTNETITFTDITKDSNFYKRSLKVVARYWSMQVEQN